MFQADYETAQMEIDMNTIAADAIEECYNELCLAANAGLPFEDETYAGRTFAEIGELADKRGLTADKYLDMIADRREAFLNMRPIPVIVPKTK